MRELERKIDARVALLAYQKIVEKGERDGDITRLGDLTARSDFDGYTIILSDGTVTARVLFHNKVAIDTPNGKALERFVQRLQDVAGVQN